MRIQLSAAVIALGLPLYAMTLNEMVQETLYSNPEMQMHVSDYKAVKYDLDRAYAGYKPTLDLSGSYGYEEVDKERDILDNELMRREIGVVARENLFRGFNTQYDVKEQKARIEGARQSALQTANTLALRSSEVYLQVLRQKSLLDLEQENIETHERIYSMIRQKTEQGLGRRSDVEQTEGRLALAYANYITQMNNYQDALANFERVYGKSYPVSQMSMPENPALPAGDLETLTQMALQYNPTIVLEAADIETRKMQHQKDKSLFYPTIDAELSADWNDNISGIEGQDDSYKAMLRGYYNLYNGGADEALRLQNLQYIESQYESKKNQERAVSEKTRLSYNSAQIIARQLRCLELHAKLSQKTSDSYAKEYQLGRRSLLDLLNVELEYNEARSKIINSEHELLFAHYRILESMGLLNFALESNIEKDVEAELPEDVELALKEMDPELSLFDIQSGCVDINTVCIEPYRETTDELAALDAEAEAAADDVPEEITALLATSAATGAMDGASGMVMENILFKYKSSDITDETREYLGLVANEMIKHPEKVLVVNAYTDSIGHKAYNVGLSNERANTVRDALIAAGMAEDQIKAVGQGEENPIASNDTEEGRAKNRRVEFALQ
jgi:adhesin transport system outer membrane protein